MAQDLAKFTFTNQADKAISNTGWEVDFYEDVDTFSGDDITSGVGNLYGITVNRGSINTDNGNDSIAGHGRYGIELYRSSINAGSGGDSAGGLHGGAVGRSAAGVLHMQSGLHTIN